MSTSKLQRSVATYLYSTYPNLDIRENSRPEWLLDTADRRLELDFWIPEYDFALEINGLQHYEYVEHFHGSYDNFLDQQKRDRIKSEACVDYGIDLRIIHDEAEAEKIFIELDALINPRKSELGNYVIPERLENKQPKKNQRLELVKKRLHNAVTKNMRIELIQKRQKAMRDVLLDLMYLASSEEVALCMDLLKQSDQLIDEFNERVSKNRARKLYKSNNHYHRLYLALEKQCSIWNIPCLHIGRKLNNAEFYLQVYHIESNLYLVYGHRGVYEVYISENRVSCECREHKDQRLCMHVAAVYLNFLTNTNA